MSSIHAYIENIQEKTGKSVDDIRALAAAQGITKHGEAVAWLKSALGLGHGHASMLAKLILDPGSFARPDSARIEGQYTGKKAHWRSFYDRLLADVQRLGPDVGTDASDAYVSFVRNGKKFAIAQPSTADRFDLGIKLKGEPATEKFEAAGKWNAMVTHRVRISDPAQLDDEVMAWIARAYAAVKP
jgi:predicted transport protein